MVRLKDYLSTDFLRSDSPYIEYGESYLTFNNKKYMYVLRRQVAAQKGIATLLASALVLWALGTHLFSVAEAANLTSIRDTLSNSAPSEVSNHTFEFTLPTGDGIAAGETVVITFPAGFNMGSVAFGDVDIEVNTVDQTVAAVPSGSTWGAAVSGQVLTLTNGNVAVSAGDDILVQVGTNASGGTNQVTNPAGIQSYEFTIVAGVEDSGQFRVAIVDDVEVTANVNTTLTFTVSGTSNGTTVNGSPTTTATTTTSNTLPFETLTGGTSKTLAQDLSVATNAIQGYVVTVEQSQNLLSSTGADIDGFIDGAYTDTPTAWVAPSNSISDEDTWGHWGLTTDDSTLLGAGTDFGSDEWVSASTTPRAVMAHDGPSDGVTDDIGAARVGYQAQITALQEAGDDYNTTLTYIATPTF